MDFLEDLFDLGDRKRRKRSGQGEDEDHHDHDREHGDADRSRQYPPLAYPQTPLPQAAFLAGAVCRQCSRPTVPGAKFCHECGTAVATTLKCASCGSLLPANGLFCAQCGYKTG